MAALYDLCTFHFIIPRSRENVVGAAFTVCHNACYLWTGNSTQTQTLVVTLNTLQRAVAHSLAFLMLENSVWIEVIDAWTDLAGNIPGKIAVRGEFEVACVLAPVVHYYNVPRLHRDKEWYINNNDRAAVIRAVIWIRIKWHEINTFDKEYVSIIWSILNSCFGKLHWHNLEL